MSAVKACMRCVGVLALAFGAYAQVYASRSGWNVQELRETAHDGTTSPLSHSPFFPFSLLLPYCSFFILLPFLPLFMFTDCVLSFKTPTGRSFGPKQKTDVSLHVVAD